MRNRWNQSSADVASAGGEIELRAYSSRLLGLEEDLVLHGGGNTSVKGTLTDVFGEPRRVLFVKGSGWDLKTIEAAGFPAVDLDYLLKLAELQSLSDSEMMRQLRLALLDPTAPTPSVEAILHALIPFKFVDHSHADAVVAISNTPDGESRLREIYGESVLILPYVMPGFVLAQQVAEAARSVDWNSISGIILLNHGLITFADDAKNSYDMMVELVTRAEEYLAVSGASDAIVKDAYQAQPDDFLEVARLRRQAAEVFGAPVLVQWDQTPEAVGFSCLPQVTDLAVRGPLTPDHTIHTKGFAAIFSHETSSGLDEFATSYRSYFETYGRSFHQCLDKLPRYGVWLQKGMLYLAANYKRLQVVEDISRHTIRAIQWGEALAHWQALPGQDLFDVEYWELEQAKLKSTAAKPALEGRVALVTGAASGIGKACVEELRRQGAVVTGVDIDPNFLDLFKNDAGVLSINCDVTDQGSLRKSIYDTIVAFGGLDIVVSNAGSFPSSAAIVDMDDDVWASSIELNLTSHMNFLRECTPYLEHGIDPAVVMLGSKNVPAPGPGASAYSVAKAGLTQLSRVAALELAGAGVRVNVVHPNAVFDTGIWTEEVLQQRAANYGMKVSEYKQNNLLQREVTSRDVAAAVAFLASPDAACTTGAQVPVDGGNDRVI